LQPARQLIRNVRQKGALDIMIFDLEEKRKWVKSEPRIKAPQRRIIFAAMDAFQSLEGMETVTPRQLARIIAAAKCQWVVANFVGGQLLAALAATHLAAQEAVRALMASRKCNERHDALHYLTAKMPRPLVLELLSLGLNDRSKSVRRVAAQMCGHLGLKELLPQMERCAICEPDTWVKEQLLFHARAIRRTVR
jgi:hypothetical protein